MLKNKWLKVPKNMVLNLTKKKNYIKGQKKDEKDKKKKIEFIIT